VRPLVVTRTAPFEPGRGAVNRLDTKAV